MKTSGIIGIVVVIAVIILLLGGCSYNRLIGLSQQTDQQWAQVQNVYQRRADLIPNLVATVSGAANFEKSTLVQVTDARASVGRVSINASSAPDDAAKLQEFEKAQGQLSSALSRLLVVSEQYPQLRATENFRELQSQLEGTENRISVERGKFNDTVRSYDTAVQTFPTALWASMLGFKTKPYFTAVPGAEQAPRVNFDFNTSAPAKQ